MARGVSSAFARKLLDALAKHGADAHLQPSESPEATAPRRSSRTGLVAALGVLALGGIAAGIGLTRSPTLRQAAREISGLKPGDPEQPTAAAPEESALPTQDIAKLASPSTVSLHCGGKTGSGFFVDAELVLTNEHVVCPPGKMMDVVLPDGRQLLGETVKSDVDLDLATVRVVGAKGTPLKLGDVTLLQPGDKLVFIGSPKGMDFTVHEGKVGFVGREYLGNGYVQFNASVNPGNSGGPLLNGRGEVVGVVSMKVNDADGMGLALPIPYASKLITLPSTPEAKARWEELLARVARDEQREVQRYQQQTSEPVLLSVRHVDELGLVALLVERFDTPPRRVVRRVEAESEGKKCSLTLSIEYWRPVRDTMSATEDSRRLRWFAAKGLTEGVYVGAVRLPVEDCTLTGTGNASLKMEGAGEDAERFDVPMKDFHASLEEWKRNKGGIQMWQQSLWQRREAADRSRQESDEWRSNFGRARARIAALEEEKRKLLEEEAAGGTATKRRWEVEVELKLAQGQLADLERYAAEKNVPASWRQ
ncbi:serine protease [Pyxidicoccus parkwayensis]|uniref:Serine protease n=1 Tax=Pyxidicoccus parkwayensis TaxID=2813578 RepID=A0ABX7P0R8_9BACT|nr:S1C family serine protease [Pyxidicoccus parkwaysis]QSQ23290.1 serine protease [Pyxidicoccus parkwaysis]